MTERTVRIPALIEGETIISALDLYNKRQKLGVLYHGSRPLVNELKPQIVYWKKDDTLYPDSDTEVVCATDNATIATFMALAPRRGLPFGYEPNEAGGVDFWLDKSVKEEFTDNTGYVCVLDSNQFEIFNGGVPHGYPGSVKKRGQEMRATTTQRPLFNVKVTHNDFLKLLDADPRCNLQYR